MLKMIKELVGFIQNVAGDVRIPDRDKKILLVLIALILSPIDLIPDWIPVIGVLDDFILLAIVLDYFFNHLDQVILLTHFPWNMRRFIQIRRFARFIAWVTPPGIKNKIWKFEPSVYSK